MFLSFWFAFWCIFTLLQFVWFRLCEHCAVYRVVDVCQIVLCCVVDVLCRLSTAELNESWYAGVRRCAIERFSSLCCTCVAVVNGWVSSIWLVVAVILCVVCCCVLPAMCVQLFCHAIVLTFLRRLSGAYLVLSVWLFDCFSFTAVWLGEGCWRWCDVSFVIVCVICVTCF